MTRTREEGWLSGAADIAEYLGWTTARVYDWSGRGLPCVRAGKQLMARPSQLDEWVESHV